MAPASIRSATTTTMKTMTASAKSFQRLPLVSSALLPRLESGPVFSPDGSMVAYTGDYDGNEDVYVVPATGGEPRRLTHHPAPDVVLGTM